MRENQFYVNVCVSNNHLPLLHLRSRDIDAVGLTSTTHGEVLVNGSEVVLGVSLGSGGEHLDMVEDMVVEGEVVAGDDVNAGVLLDLPVLESESLSLSEEFVTRELLAPVGLVGLLEVTEASHAGETQDG